MYKLKSSKSDYQKFFTTMVIIIVMFVVWIFLKRSKKKQVEL